MSRDTIRNTSDITRAFNIDFFGDITAGEIEINTNFNISLDEEIVRRNNLTEGNTSQNFLGE